MTTAPTLHAVEVAQTYTRRCFALPCMQFRQSALAANLLLGVLWGLWHFPLKMALGLPLTAVGLVQFITA